MGTGTEAQSMDHRSSCCRFERHFADAGNEAFTLGGQTLARLAPFSLYSFPTAYDD